MSKAMVITLMIGTGVMFIPIVLVGKFYKISVLKSLMIALNVTMIGTIGAQLMFFVENGHFGGYSFYGAVFLVLILSGVSSRVLKLPHDQFMDCCAPAGCAMVSFMKTRCIATGCCAGRIFYMSGTQEAIQFPSQIVELCTGLVLAVVIVLMICKGKGYGTLYAWFMILYGVTRFVLNYFRLNQTVFLLGMAPGNFWSIISIMIGLAWLLFFRKKETEYFIHSVI